jgi:hypothetical protein
MPLTSKARTAWAAVSVMCITTACKDVPLLPQWNADWNLPLPSQAVPLPVGVIPSGFPPQQVSFPAQQQQLSSSIGSLLKQDLSNASVVLTLAKTLNLNGTDTLFIASSNADLTNAAATRIVIPVSFTAADRTVVDTATVNAIGLGMLQSVADNDGSLFIQLRGSVQNSSGAPVAVTSADSIHVKLALLATIGVSR